jgi:hypothetical protein
MEHVTVTASKRLLILQKSVKILGHVLFKAANVQNGQRLGPPMGSFGFCKCMSQFIT